MSSPLHRAATHGLDVRVRNLLASGADCNARDESGNTPLLLAIKYGNYEMAKAILDAGAMVNDGHPLVLEAMSRGKLEIARDLIERGADVDAKNNEEWTPLHVALRYDHPEIAKDLLERGADVDAKNNLEWTPLHFAILYHHTEIAKDLLERRADVDAKNNQEWTPLHFAIRYDHPEIAKDLLERGADVDAKDDEEWTPLHYALRNGHLEIAKDLLERGADVNAKNNHELTPLLYALGYDHPEIAKDLLERGADVDAKNNQEWTPLHIAIRYDHPEIAKDLLERGADVDAKDNQELTPLHYALRYDHPEIAKDLLERGADVDAKDNQEWTPLHIAARHGYGNIILNLIELGAKRDVRNEDGNLPIDLIEGNREDLSNMFASNFVSSEVKEASSTQAVKKNVDAGEKAPDSSSLQEHKQQGVATMTKELCGLKDGDTFAEKYAISDGVVSGKPHILFAENDCTGDQVVLKFYSEYELFANSVKLHKEIKKLKSVCTMVDFYKADSNLPHCIVFEKGVDTLATWMTKKNPALIERKCVLLEILHALRDIHSNNVVHCDLKPSNIMVFDDYNWKLVDMDSAVRADEPSAIRATLAYAAPEIAKARREKCAELAVSTAVDMWSFGVIAFEVLSGKKYHEPSLELIEVEDALITGNLPTLDDIEDETDRIFVTKLLELNPADRIDAVQAIEFPSFKFIDVSSTTLLGE